MQSSNHEVFPEGDAVAFGRLRLREPVDMQRFLNTREMQFEVDSTAHRMRDDECDNYWNEATDLIDSEGDEDHENMGDRSDEAQDTAELQPEAEAPVVQRTALSRFANIAQMREQEKAKRAESKKKITHCKMFKPWAAEGMTPITDDGQLLKLVRHPGNGVKPPIGSRVWIHYIIFRESDRQRQSPIDNAHSDMRGSPFVFTLFQHNVLAALEYGVASMEVNEKAQFLASSNYAYGPMGVPQMVEPNTNCVFIVELLKFVDTSLSKTVLGMNPEEQAELGFIRVIDAANQFKAAGNLQYKAKRLEPALQNYKKGILILDRHLTLDKEEESKRNELIFIFHINMAQTYLELEDWQRALSSCVKAEQLPPDTIGNRSKLEYRQCIAYMKLDKLELARDACRKAMKLEPGNASAVKLYEDICQKLAAEDVTSKGIYEKMAKGYFTSSVQVQSASASGNGV